MAFLDARRGEATQVIRGSRLVAVAGVGVFHAGLEVLSAAAMDAYEHGRATCEAMDTEEEESAYLDACLTRLDVPRYTHAPLLRSLRGADPADCEHHAKHVALEPGFAEDPVNAEKAFRACWKAMRSFLPPGRNPGKTWLRLAVGLKKRSSN